MDVLTAEQARALQPLSLEAVKSGDHQKIIERAQAVAQTEVQNRLQAKMTRLRDASGGQPVRHEVLEAAIDPVREVPLLDLLRGNGHYGNESARRWVDVTLAGRNIERPSLTAKAGEIATTKAAEQAAALPPLSPGVADFVFSRFNRRPETLTGSANDRALIQFSEDAIKQRGLQEKIKEKVELEKAMPGSLAERVAKLRGQGDKISMLQADEIVKASRELQPLQMPPGQLEKVAEIRTFTALVDRIQHSYSAEFVGPIRGRAGWLAEKTGVITDKEVEFRTFSQSLENQLLLLRSGAAITETEYQRLRAELPNPTNAPNVFAQKAKTFRTILTDINRARLDTFKQFGYIMPPDLSGTGGGDVIQYEIDPATGRLIRRR